MKKAPAVIAGLLIMCWFLPPAAAKADGSGFITSIAVEGNQRVSERSIVGKLLFAVGEPFDPSLVTPSVKELYSLGAFERVAIDDRTTGTGVEITVTVAERPMVVGVQIEGNDALDASDIKELLGMKTFSFYDPARTATEVEAIRAHYKSQGFYKARVAARTEREDKGVRIFYRIDEGEKTLVTEIDIIGNRSVSDHDIVKVMALKEAGPLSFMGSSGGFDESLVKDDLLRIKSLYMEKGFLDVSVDPPEAKLHPDGSGMYVSLRVQEGPRYRVGKVTYSGDWDALPGFARRDPSLKTGDVFARSVVVQDVRMLEDSYRDQGYARCRVEPRIDADPDTATVDLELALVKGPMVQVRWVTISGNFKTRDYVIRREMKVIEGDRFDQSKLDASRRQVRSLGFFESVQVSVQDVGEDQADILVKVREGSAGSFSAGLAYSSVDGLVGTLQLALQNFLGRGQQFKLDTEFGGDVTTYTASFTEPRLFSGDFSFGLDLEDRSRTYDQYTQDNRGGSIRLGYRFSDRSSASMRYKYFDYSVFDVAEDATLFIQEQEGDSTTSSITFSYAYDRRDFPLDPREGYRVSLSAELAGGGLGGTNNFVRNRVEGSYFHPLYRDLIGSAHLELGAINPYDGSEVPITERFFMGGLYTLRGFEHRSVGPKEDDEPVGGTKSLLLNLEGAFPLVKDAGIKGVLFFDTGFVWADGEEVSLGDLRKGAGFGFRWVSPMGLLRLEWGFNLDPEPDEIQPGWEFSIGNIF